MFSVIHISGDIKFNSEILSCTVIYFPLTQGQDYFQQYFRYIVAVMFLVEEPGVPDTTTDLSQVSSTPCHERDQTSHCQCRRTLIAHVVVNLTTIRSRPRRPPLQFTINSHGLLYKIKCIKFQFRIIVWVSADDVILNSNASNSYTESTQEHNCI